MVYFSFFLEIYRFILSSFSFHRKYIFSLFTKKESMFLDRFVFEDYIVQHTYPEQSFELNPEQKISNI